MVHDLDVLVEAISNRSLADQRERCIGVGCAGAGNQEELRREVLQVVCRERTKRHAVDRQFPHRQMARVAMEEPVWVAWRDVDVATAIADHEGATFQDAYGRGIHSLLLCNYTDHGRNS